MYKEVFKMRLYAKRKELGLSQTTVSNETEINQSNISKFETGALEPNIDTLAKLANYYQVSIDWLVGNPHNGREGNEALAAINELYNDIIDTINGAEDQRLNKEETIISILKYTTKKKDELIERYSIN